MLRIVFSLVALWSTARYVYCDEHLWLQSLQHNAQQALRTLRASSKDTSFIATRLLHVSTEKPSNLNSAHKQVIAVKMFVDIIMFVIRSSMRHHDNSMIRHVTPWNMLQLRLALIMSHSSVYARQFRLRSTGPFCSLLFYNRTWQFPHRCTIIFKRLNHQLIYLPIAVCRQD